MKSQNRLLFFTSIAIAIAALSPLQVIAQALSGTSQPKATAAARAAQMQEQQQKLRPSNFDLKVYPVSEPYVKHWEDTLWAVGVLLPEDEYVMQALESILQMTTATNLSDPQKGIIDMAMHLSNQLYTLKPLVYGKLKSHFLRTIDYSQDSQWVAIAIAALAKSERIEQIKQRVQNRFPNWEQDIYLRITLNNIEINTKPVRTDSTIPSLADLLKWQIAPQQSHLYVLCRPNRDVLCLALLKDNKGNFLKINGKLWYSNLLLQSLQNIDWNLTNGRTPQGIYRIEGVVPQPDDEVFQAYGQFPLVKLFVPFEEGVTAFLPNQAGKFTGDLAAYQALLPPTWRSYTPIHQSYWAGSVGRSLFRIHGSGDAIDFYRSKSEVVSSQNFNWNPTLGCLSAVEIYDRSGKLLRADMPKILNALNTAGNGKVEGFAIVVDIPGSSDTPVALSELSAYLERN